MELSIVIVNWNSKELLRQCLVSMEAASFVEKIEIIVVDNASYDGCRELLAREFAKVIFIQSEKNLGFARANNLGFQRSQGRTLLFLNPDTEVVGQSLNVLVNQLHSLPGAGAAGAKLLNSNGIVQTSCIQSFPTLLNQALDTEFLRTRFPSSQLWGMAPLFFGNNVPSEVEMLSGAGIMVKRKVFEQVGMFSEEYFMYAEDLDLCFKIRQAGYKNYYVPSATIIHHGGGSSQSSRSDFSAVMMRESNCRFLTKTKGSTYGMAYCIAMIASAAVRLLFVGLSTLPKLACRNRSTASCTLHKWLAILKWSLGMQSWVRKQ